MAAAAPLLESAGRAAGPGGGAAAAGSGAAAPSDGPPAGQPSGGPQQVAARARGRAWPRQNEGPRPPLSFEGVLEHLEAALRGLSSETRRRVLETHFTQSHRQTLEQWMVARQAAKTSAADQDATGAPADSSESSSSFGSDASDSSESQGARLALEDLPPDAAEEARYGAGVPSADRGMDDGDPEEGNGAFEKDMQLPGLVRRKLAGGGYSYHAEFHIYGLVFHTKSVQDLAAAIDFHVVFMTIRERIPPVEALDASSIEPLFLKIADEQGLHVEQDMDLKVTLRLNNTRFLLGIMHLVTPRLPFSNIREVMSLWAQTVQRFWAGKTNGKAGSLFQRFDPDKMRKMWLAAHECYLRWHALKGPDGADLEGWLDKKYAERAAFRERQLEKWNIFHMKLEDPKHGYESRNMKLFFHRQRERQAMAAEDGGAERTRSLNQEWHLLERIRVCLQKWRRLDAAGAKRRRQDEAASAKRRRLERAEQRLQRSQREARWRAARAARDEPPGWRGGSR